MQASNEAGKVGGRSTRPTEGDKAAQEVGKISKSRGASPFSEMLKDFQPEGIRFFLLATHYRRPIDFSEGHIREVETGMETFYRFFKRLERISGQQFYSLPAPARRGDGEFDPAGDPLLVDVAEMRKRFLEWMDDDFNTGGAIGVLYDLVRRLNKYCDDEKLEEPGNRDPGKAASLARGATTFRELALTLGLFGKPPAQKAAGGDHLSGKLVELLIEVRADARKGKNFAMADKIRNSLAEMGVVLEDRPGGTQWSIGK
jgi:cysteinyl-tRNA synthetase